MRSRSSSQGGQVLVSMAGSARGGVNQSGNTCFARNPGTRSSAGWRAHSRLGVAVSSWFRRSELSMSGLTVLSSSDPSLCAWSATRPARIMPGCVPGLPFGSPTAVRDSPAPGATIVQLGRPPAVRRGTHWVPLAGRSRYHGGYRLRNDSGSGIRDLVPAPKTCRERLVVLRGRTCRTSRGPGRRLKDVPRFARDWPGDPCCFFRARQASVGGWTHSAAIIRIMPVYTRTSRRVSDVACTGADVTDQPRIRRYLARWCCRTLPG